MQKLLNKKFLIGMLGLIFMPCLASAADDIKIATKSYMTRAFTPTKELLAQTNTIITDLITQSNTNTGDIGTLSTGKQNRPATDCEAGKQCLLVKNASNVDAWYPIVDCGGEGFLSNVGNPDNIGLSSGGYYTDSVCSQSEQTTYGCNSNEGIEAYTGGIVFYQSIRAHITDNTRGEIVVLPSNIQDSPNGTVTLCRVTGYRVKDGNSYAERVNVNTDRWVIGPGNCSRYLSGNANGNQELLNEAKAYYASLDDTCLSSSDYRSASMCDVNDFLNNPGQADTLYSGSSYSMGHNFNGTNNNLCITLASSNKACGTNEFVSSYTYGLVYGAARDVSVSAEVGSIVKLPNNAQDVPDGYNGTHACLCKVTGYSIKNGSTYSAKQSFDTDLWIVIQAGGVGPESCLSYCARGVYASTYDEYYQAISSSCTDLSQFPNATVVAPTCDNSLESMCTTSGGTWSDAPTCSCTCPAHATLTQAGRCACDEGYYMPSGTNECVLEQEQPRSCESEEGMALKKQNCQHSGGTWNSDNCTCDCSSKPHSSINNDGWCACVSGYQADGNYSCVSTDNGCEQITSIIEPGNLIDNGEAWVGFGGVPGALAGGKACDGRIAGIPDAYTAYDAQHSCHANEWVHAYENVAIFGEARMVAINEDTPGDIIQLPNNVQDVNAGGVCVCRVTAYESANGSTGSGSWSGVLYDPRVSIDTGNKWIIAGRQVSYNEEYTGVQNCITNCAFYTPTSLVEYYDYIGNGCTNVTGTTATACLVANPETTTTDQYMTFVNAAVDQDWISNASIGFAAVGKTGKGTGFCENNNSAYCQASEGDLTAWALQMRVSDPNKYFNTLGEQVSNPYNGQVVLYGRARCVDNSGELAKVQSNKGTVVNLTEVPSNSERGTVCIQNIAGYMRGEKETTTLRSSYWYATKFESAESCATACASATSQEMMTEIGELSEPIGGLCLNNEE